VLQNLYKIEWSQHAFPFYNIQSLDIVQLPREPQDMVAFDGALSSTNLAERPKLATRKWELTNTRFLLGVTEQEEAVNRQLDPVKHRFRIAQRFRLVAKPGVNHVTGLDQISAEFDANGPFAIYEFAGALPRAKLYASWAIAANDAAVLTQLASRSFQPQQSVIVASGNIPESRAAGTNENAGSVQYIHYSSKDVSLKTIAPGETVLLLNDRYDPNWKVFVDGKAETLLRCNYLMRGVHLAPGQHDVELRFQPPDKTLPISVAGIGLGIVLLCGVIATGRQSPAKTATVPAARKVSPASNPPRVGKKRAVVEVSRNGK
jgi:hypothetical protein